MEQDDGVTVLLVQHLRGEVEIAWRRQPVGGIGGHDAADRIGRALDRQKGQNVPGLEGEPRERLVAVEVAQAAVLDEERRTRPGVKRDVAPDGGFAAEFKARGEIDDVVEIGNPPRDAREVMLRRDEFDGKGVRLPLLPSMPIEPRERSLPQIFAVAPEAVGVARLVARVQEMPEFMSDGEALPARTHVGVDQDSPGVPLGRGDEGAFGPSAVIAEHGRWMLDKSI